MINIVILKTTIMITDDNNENIIKKKDGYNSPYLCPYL